MKNLIIITLTVLITVSVAQAVSIRDRAEYVPSSSLSLGSLDATKGYALASDFQLNLEYQIGIANSSIEGFNDWRAPSLGSWNFPDGDDGYYFLKIDQAGSLPIGIYDYETPPEQLYSPDSGSSWAQWTLSYWDDQGGNWYFQTILAGDIIDNTLHVNPTGEYRTFLWDGLANAVEVFGGATIDCEVLGYSFTGQITNGSILTPNLVPEPATMVLVGLGGIFLRRKIQ